MAKPDFFLPKSKYTKDVNPTVGYSYNQSAYAGGFRNDCSGFVSDVLRTNGYAVPKDFTTANIKSWAGKSNPYFESVGTGKTMSVDDFKNGDVVMLGSGHTGIVFTDTDQVKKIADWGSNANGFRTSPVKLETALAIARALVMQPRVLILDEATSMLDADTEMKFWKHIRAIAEQRTVIAITHRLSTVLDMDRIIVMESGDIAQIGTPAELLIQGGRFADLYEMQLGLPAGQSRQFAKA